MGCAYCLNRQAVIESHQRLNDSYLANCGPSFDSGQTTAVAEECELAFQQFSGYSRRLKGCFPESSSNGRLLSDDISVARMTNLGGQL
jgi:hypothetical protein